MITSKQYFIYKLISDYPHLKDSSEINHMNSLVTAVKKGLPSCSIPYRVARS